MFAALDRIRRAFGARISKFTKAIVESDLVDAVNGEAYAVTIGTLPAGAMVLGRAVKITTYFTGGSASAVTLKIGNAGDDDAIMAALNVFDTTTTAIWLQGTAGVTPIGPYSGALLATFTPDAGHNLTALTAGALSVEIYYVNAPDLSQAL